LVCRNAAFKLRAAQQKLCNLGLPSNTPEYNGSSDMPEKFKDTLREASGGYALVQKLKHGLELNVDSPRELLEQKERYLKLDKAVSCLKPVYQELLKMFYYEDLSYKEISEKTGMSSGLVGFKLNYAKQKVKEIMEKQNG